MDFNVTEIKQSFSLFQLPVPLNLRKIFIDLINQWNGYRQVMMTGENAADIKLQ